MDNVQEMRRPAMTLDHSLRRPKFRQATFEDYEQITRLESRHRLETKSYEEWIHFWQGNPVYRDLQRDWPIGWVIEDDDGQIVGAIGNVPLSYEFQGRRILAATSRSWVVERPYRGASLSLFDRVIKQGDVDLLVFNTVGALSLPVFKIFHYPPVPVGVWDEFAFWVTNYRFFFETITAMKNYRLAKPLSYPADSGGYWTRWACMRCRLAKPLSYPLSAAAFLRDRLTNKLFRDSDVDVRPCSSFDDRFDAFWEGVKRNNPHVLLAVRSREVLEWHFKYALRNNRLWIAAVMDGPRLAAYAIFDRRNFKSGFKRARLVDFQSLDGSPDLLAPILAWALRKCRAEGIHTLEHTGRWLEEGEIIEAAAPYRRKAAWSYFYRANNPALAETLKDRRVWAPSLFDGDASL